jgi:hypothetical protein
VPIWQQLLPLLVHPPVFVTVNFCMQEHPEAHDEVACAVKV